MQGLTSENLAEMILSHEGFKMEANTVEVNGKNLDGMVDLGEKC